MPDSILCAAWLPPASDRRSVRAALAQAFPSVAWEEQHGLASVNVVGRSDGVEVRVSRLVATSRFSLAVTIPAGAERELLAVRDEVLAVLGAAIGEPTVWRISLPAGTDNQSDICSRLAASIRALAWTEGDSAWPDKVRVTGESADAFVRVYRQEEPGPFELTVDVRPLPGTSTERRRLALRDAVEAALGAAA
jgi:hypothetical protein